jgi:hypothetical protein
MYVASMIRSVIALHSLIGNKLMLRQLETAAVGGVVVAAAAPAAPVTEVGK